MALQGAFVLLYFNASMRMGSVPQERPVPQSSQLPKDGVFLEESAEAMGARQKASIERAKEKKEEILWKALRTAEAAVQIEKYFRAAPKDPSLHDIMLRVEVPVGSVNREFLRMVGVVSERFTRQRQDVHVAMTALKQRAAAGREWVENQKIAELVFSQINPKIKNVGALQVAERDGYFVLSVANHADYHALYGEDTEAKKSGGRFHRALRITVAGLAVPVIVHPGSTIFNEDTNEIMIHEKQHWINESLVKLGFIESERPSLMTIQGDERQTALLKERHHRAIKDEVLAYLRQGQVRNIKQTLFGDLYRHLFASQPTEKRKQEDQALVTAISDEFDRCADIFANNSHLRTAMVYVLMGVKLRRFPEYLVSMRGLLERANGLEDAAKGDTESDMGDVGMLPRAYQEDHAGLLDAQSAVGELAQKAWQTQAGFGPRDDSRSFLALREKIKVAAANRAQRFEAIMREGVFPPYLVREYRGYLLEDEEFNERELSISVLDVLSSVTNASLQNICLMRHVNEELLVISENIKAILVDRGRIDPTVTFSVADKGVQVHVQYRLPRPTGDAIAISDVYVLTRSRTWGFSKTPRARDWDFDNAVVCIPDCGEEPGVIPRAVRQTQEITTMLDCDIGEYQVARLHLSQAIEEGKSRYTLVELARVVQLWRGSIEEARRPFFRDGAHIPDVGWFERSDSWDAETITEPVYRAAEGLRNTLFDVASAYPQGIIDGAINDIENNADSDATDRVQGQFDALLEKQIKGRQFGSGKIKNIRCGGVFLGTEKGTLGAKVMFDVQRRTGGFFSTSVDVIYHRTAIA